MISLVSEFFIYDLYYYNYHYINKIPKLIISLIAILHLKSLNSLVFIQLKFQTSVMVTLYY